MKFTIYGQPCSKANSRRLVKFGNKPAFIKSEKALTYEKDFKSQCPQREDLFEENVKVTITIYYQSRRPDLDESVILDCMQGFIYKNDRQVKEKHIYWGLDALNPRSDIEVEEI
jgi:Holliday junction resolvase RusA-like endonuclease|tara:strand:- start:1856 stop:2197 length:342 start_codon:yes stop_codon:yes gene_type:complete